MVPARSRTAQQRRRDMISAAGTSSLVLALKASSQLLPPAQPPGRPAVQGPVTMAQQQDAASDDTVDHTVNDSGQPWRKRLRTEAAASASGDGSELRSEARTCGERFWLAGPKQLRTWDPPAHIKGALPIR